MGLFSGIGDAIGDVVGGVADVVGGVADALGVSDLTDAIGGILNGPLGAYIMAAFPPARAVAGGLAAMEMFQDLADQVGGGERA